MFNVLRYIKRLQSVGVPRDQAEVHAELVMNAIEGEVATKSDIGEIKTEFATFRGEMAQEFLNVRSEMAQEFAKVRGEMTQEFADVRLEMARMENRLMLRFGGLMIACMTLQTGILGFLMNYRFK